MANHFTPMRKIFPLDFLRQRLTWFEYLMYFELPEWFIGSFIAVIVASRVQVCVCNMKLSLVHSTVCFTSFQKYYDTLLHSHFISREKTKCMKRMISSASKRSYGLLYFTSRRQQNKSQYFDQLQRTCFESKSNLVLQRFTEKVNTVVQIYFLAINSLALSPFSYSPVRL